MCYQESFKQVRVTVLQSPVQSILKYLGWPTLEIKPGSNTARSLKAILQPMFAKKP